MATIKDQIKQKNKDKGPSQLERSANESKRLRQELEAYSAEIQKKYKKEVAKLEAQELLHAAKQFGITVNKEFEKAVGSGVDKFAQGFTGILSGLAKSTSKQMNEYFGYYESYMSTIATRLSGTTSDYNKLVDNINSAVGFTSTTSIKDVLSNVKQLIEAGVVNNLEQRAILATLSDRIATTFSAMDTTLLQLARLTKSGDLTSAYLGMEATLNEYLNSMYSDSAYLSKMRDSVSASILDATAQMTADAGAEFEFNVHKWLGAFYSSGTSDTLISNIATAIGYLGSGNVGALTSNSTLNSMVAMAANKVGLNYGELLLDGLDSGKVSKLLQGIYQTAMSISSSTDNLVTRSQYSQLFGLSTVDIKAIESINGAQVTDLIGSTLSMDSMLARTSEELANVASRTGMKQKMDNVIQNVMADVADKIVQSQVGYITYRILDYIGDRRVPIPFVGMMNVTETAKGAIVGMGLLAEVGEIVGRLSKGGTLGLDLSALSETATTGAGYSSLERSKLGETISTTSRVTYIGEDLGSSLLKESAAGNETLVKTATATVPEIDTEEILDAIREHTASMDYNLKQIVAALISDDRLMQILESIRLDLQSGTNDSQFVNRLVESMV